MAQATAIFSEWVRDVTRGRDESHGMDHFERVRTLALHLASAEPGYVERPSLLLELAALAHGVADRKHLSSPRDAAAVLDAVKEALTSRCGLAPERAAEVILIAENVSLSKELRGELETERLRSARLLWERTFVSDADKIEALGPRGLRRLLQYRRCSYLRRAEEDGDERRKERCSDALLAAVREDAERHLLPREGFVRSARGKALAAKGAAELRELLLDTARLESFVCLHLAVFPQR